MEASRMTTERIAAIWREHTGGCLSAPVWLHDDCARFQTEAGDLFVYSRVPEAKLWTRVSYPTEQHLAAVRSIRRELAESPLIAPSAL